MWRCIRPRPWPRNMRRCIGKWWGSEIGDRRSGVGGRGSEIGGRKSEVGSQQEGYANQLRQGSRGL